MLLQILRPNMPSMTGHIHQDFDAHSSLLEIRKIPIPRWILLRLLLVYTRNPRRVRGNDFVLFIPMTHQAGAPFPIHLLEEEAEATVSLDIKLNIINDEALRDGGFELGDRVGAGGVDVGSAAMAAVHDEGALVHTGFGCGDELGVRDAAGPGSIDVCVGVEDGFEVLPFTRIAAMNVSYNSCSLSIRA